MADQKKIEDFIIKNRLGNDSILKFKNDPVYYAFKNFSPNKEYMFVSGLNGLGIWKKKTLNIIDHNYKPIKENVDNSINFEIDWSSLNYDDIVKFSEDIYSDYSVHAIERAYERNEKPFIKVKEDVQELINKAESEIVNLSDKFRTFVLKGKNNLNVVGNLVKKGRDYVFRIITVMWKKHFIPKNPNDKVININEAYEINIYKNLLNLKEMEGGKSNNMSINDIAILHKVKVELIKQQLALGIPIEAKEHSYDLAIAKQIAMDHLVENPNYYTEYIAKMETGDIKTESTQMLKEEEIDVNQTIEEEPTAIVSEETEAKVDLKRDVMSVVNSLEDIIISAEDWNNAVPIKVNALSRINSILKACRSLYLDLEASINLIAESVVEEKIIKEEFRKPISDELKDYNFKFKKEDVVEVVSSHYKIDSNEGGMIVITVRNPKYDNSNSLSTLNYKIHIYFGDNYVGVYPDRNDNIGETLATKIEKEIIQDLAYMHAYELPSEFVSKYSELTEDVNSEKEKNIEANKKNNKEFQNTLNEIFKAFMNSKFYNKESGIEITDMYSNIDDKERAARGEIEEDVPYYIKFEEVFNIKITEPNLLKKATTTQIPGHESTPGYYMLADENGEADSVIFNIEAKYMNDENIGIYQIEEVFVCSEPFAADEESKRIINEIFKPKVKYA